MSRHKCRRCRMAEQPPVKLYERWDGKGFCSPCLVILLYDAEVAEQNRHLDAAMSEHLRHEDAGRFAGCPICAVEV